MFEQLPRELVSAADKVKYIGFYLKNPDPQNADDAIRTMLEACEFAELREMLQEIRRLLNDQQITPDDSNIILDYISQFIVEKCTSLEEYGIDEFLEKYFELAVNLININTQFKIPSSLEFVVRGIIMNKACLDKIKSKDGGFLFADYAQTTIGCYYCNVLDKLLKRAFEINKSDADIVSMLESYYISIVQFFSQFNFSYTPNPKEYLSNKLAECLKKENGDKLLYILVSIQSALEESLLVKMLSQMTNFSQLEILLNNKIAIANIQSYEAMIKCIESYNRLTSDPHLHKALLAPVVANCSSNISVAQFRPLIANYPYLIELFIAAAIKGESTPDINNIILLEYCDEAQAARLLQAPLVIISIRDINILLGLIENFVTKKHFDEQILIDFVTKSLQSNPNLFKKEDSIAVFITKVLRQYLDLMPALLDSLLSHTTLSQVQYINIQEFILSQLASDQISLQLAVSLLGKFKNYLVPSGAQLVKCMDVIARTDAELAVEFLQDPYFLALITKVSQIDHLISILPPQARTVIQSHPRLAALMTPDPQQDKAAAKIQTAWQQYRRKHRIEPLIFKSTPQQRIAAVTCSLGDWRRTFLEEWFAEPTSDEGAQIWTTTTHRTHAANLSKILSTGAILSKQTLTGDIVDHRAGISVAEDIRRHDNELVSTAPFRYDPKLQGWPWISFITSAIATNFRLAERLLFKLSDWNIGDYTINLTPTINITVLHGSLKISYIFMRDNMRVVELTIPMSETVYHGFNGLDIFLIKYLFRVLNMASSQNPQLAEEINSYFATLAEQGKLVEYVTNCIRQFCYNSEWAFLGSLPLSVHTIDRIHFVDERELVMDVLKTNIMQGDVEAIRQVFVTYPELRLAISLVKEMFVFARDNKQEKIMEYLHAEFSILATSAVTTEDITLQNMRELLRFITRAKSNCKVTEPYYLQYNAAKQSLTITLNMDRDIRTDDTLQYDAHKLLFHALGLLQRLEYNPNPDPEMPENCQVTITLGSCDYHVNAQSKKGKYFNSLEDILAAIMHTTLTTIIAGACYGKGELDPDCVLRPNLAGYGKLAPATSYLNGHDGILAQLNTGDIQVRYIASSNGFEITANDSTKAELIANQLCRVLGHDDKNLISWDDRQIRITNTTQFICRINETATNYIAIPMLTTDSKMILFNRWHGPTNIVGYTGAGGSAPFPHDVEKSAVALLQWKLGLPYNQIIQHVKFQYVDKVSDLGVVCAVLSGELIAQIQDGIYKIHGDFYQPDLDSIRIISLDQLEGVRSTLDPNGLIQFTVLFQTWAKSLAAKFDSRVKIINFNDAGIPAGTIIFYPAKSGDEASVQICKELNRLGIVYTKSRTRSLIGSEVILVEPPGDQQQLLVDLMTTSTCEDVTHNLSQMLIS